MSVWPHYFTTPGFRENDGIVMSHRAIAERMINPTSRPNNRILQGYTYFGQFIAHDVLEATNPKCRSRFVTPQLNLDSLYGDFNYGNKWRTLFHANGKFVHNQDDQHDLVRAADGKALIPEQRNDENVIIAQLHVFWQRVHDAIVESESLNTNLEIAVGSARRKTILTFQLLTLTDFAPLIFTDLVYDQYFKNHRTYLEPRVSGIPLTFSRAAFRFGHSLVRQNYRLNQNQSSEDLKDLLQGNRSDRRIPATMAINWELFFTDKHGENTSFLVDPVITTTMENVPNCEPATQEINIASQNLMAGAILGSGHDLVQSLLAQPNGLTMASDLALSPLQDLGPPFKGLDGMTIQELPLWPYILLEASQVSRGFRLGPLGSIICAETFRWMIESSSISIYKKGQFNSADVMRAMGEWGRTLFGSEEEISMARLITVLDSIGA